MSRKKGGFLKGFLLFILAMLLGMAVLVGAVAGVFYFGVTGVTLDKLKKWGFDLGADQYFSDSGETDVRALSLLELYQELMKIAGDGDATFDSVVADYGVKIPEETLALLPPELRTLPFSCFAEEGVVEAILMALPFSYLFNVVDASALPQTLRDKLADRKLSILLESPAKMAEGLYLGDLLDIEVKEIDGVPTAVYADPDNITAYEYLAPVPLSDLLLTLEEGGSLIQALRPALETLPVTALMSGENSGGFMAALEGKTVSDLLAENATTGEVLFNLDGLLGDMYIGSLIGYTPIRSEADGLTIVGWYSEEEDGTKTPPHGIYIYLVDVKVQDLMNGDVDLIEAIEDCYIGELMNLERGELLTEATADKVATYQWKVNADTNATGIKQALANLPLKTMMGGNLSIETLGLNELHLYEVMGYEKVGDFFYSSYDASKPEENKITGPMAALMQFELGSVAEEVNALPLGELMGYRLVDVVDGAGNPVLDSEGNPIRQYVDADNNEVSGVLLSFVDLTVEQLGDSATVNAAVQGTKLGVALGYHLDGGVWKKEDAEGNLVPVEGLIKNLLDLKVVDLGDSAKITEKIDAMMLAEVLGYEKDGDTWKKDGVAAGGVLGLLMDSTVGNLNSSLDDLYLGEVIGYTGDVGNWTKDGAAPSGPIKAFVDLQIKDLGNSDTINAKVQSLTIGDAMGYTYKTVAADGVAADGWYNGTALVTGLFGSLAGSKVSELESAIQTVTLADAMGYTYKTVAADGVAADGWYDESNTAAEKMFGAMLGSKENPTTIDGVSDRIANLKTGDVFDTGSGMMSLLGPDVYLTKVDKRIVAMFPPSGTTSEYAVTIADMMQAGLLNITDDSQEMLETLFGADWAENTVDGFVTEMLTRMQYYYNIVGH